MFVAYWPDSRCRVDIVCNSKSGRNLMTRTNLNIKKEIVQVVLNLYHPPSSALTHFSFRIIFFCLLMSSFALFFFANKNIFYVDTFKLLHSAVLYVIKSYYK